MSDANPTEEGNWWHSLGGQIEAVCDRFEAAWKAGRRPSIEGHLDGVPEAHRAAVFRELLVLELAYRRRAGERPTTEEYRRRFPARVAVIDAALGVAPPSPRAGTDHTLLYAILALNPFAIHAPKPDHGHHISDPGPFT